MEDRIKIVNDDDPYSTCIVCNCNNHYSILYQIDMQTYYNSTFCFNICEKCFNEMMLQHRKTKENK